ncbi:MAG: 2-polyprenyl-3-methyl-6-methoxy-1,4-benzoquinone monooxygenase [Cellvibrionales bacterium]|nr:2-polyprenyl-3-methyl-6-methoxy-1,4-benzoquinone monooxygenase [Cellvibrionales bacterium]
MKNRSFSFVDEWISRLDNGLKTLTHGAHNSPRAFNEPDNSLAEDKAHTAGLMRINHTGEVCAQALYQGQALTAKQAHTREEMRQAADEEIDHLVWCETRLKELNSQPSLLNPAFYCLSFSVGAIAGAISDEVSLGFVAETENQVCKHLEKHLHEIPASDEKTHAILNQMLKDEAKHAHAATLAGGVNLPRPVKFGMKLMSKVMTTTTYRI